MSKSDMLTIVVSSTNEPISLNPEHSDTITNLIFMEALVGTLVKYGAQGRYLPYLAKEWTTSDFINWQFTLRDDISTENGEKITPQGFKESLERVIKIYHKSWPQLPIIEEIEGFNNFVTNKEKHISGISTTDTQLNLKFIRPKKSGVLEFLAMPYYGFYSNKNFKEGRWLDDQKLISSGSHSLESINKEEKYIVLKSRNNWFSVIEGAVKKIKILQAPYENSYEIPGPKIIGTQGVVNTEKVKKMNLKVSQNVPDMLVAFKLNDKSGMFSDKENRKLFLSKLRKVQENIKLDGEGLLFSEFFYPQYKTVLKNKYIKHDKFQTTQDAIVVLFPPSSSVKRAEYLKSLVTESMRESGISVEFKDSLSNAQSKGVNFDIKIISVSIGGGFEHWLTKMMFCSELGVGFGDPENQICDLVNKFDGSDWDINEFSAHFNEILNDQASTIPIYHNSYKWIFDGIDFEISPISFVPRLDLIKLK